MPDDLTAHLALHFLSRLDTALHHNSDMAPRVAIIIYSMYGHVGKRAYYTSPPSLAYSHSANQWPSPYMQASNPLGETPPSSSVLPHKMVSFFFLILTEINHPESLRHYHRKSFKKHMRPPNPTTQSSHPLCSPNSTRTCTFLLPTTSCNILNLVL
jgi:hypothetical protein